MSDFVVCPGSRNIVVGFNSSTAEDVDDAIVIGDGLYATESGEILIGETFFDHPVPTIQITKETVIIRTRPHPITIARQQ